MERAQRPWVRVVLNLGSVGVQSTEAQRVRFVGYTGGEGVSPRLSSLQNLHAVPPYVLRLTGGQVFSGRIIL